jgi:hypothetical protein
MAPRANPAPEGNSARGGLAMRRTWSWLASALLVIGLLASPATVGAATPLENHVIGYNAYAGFSSEDGCTSVAVLVDSSHALYMPAHGAGGGVYKQHLTNLEITVTDTCAPSVAAGGGGGGGGGGGTVVADWFGQAPVAPDFGPRLGSATLRATVAMTDELSGATASATVALRWTATSADTTAPSHYHERYPFIVILNTNSNDTNREAVADGAVTMGGVNYAPNEGEGSLWSVRFHCRQIGFGNGSSDWGLCY